MGALSRRDFVKRTAAAGTALHLLSQSAVKPLLAAETPALATQPAAAGEVELRWLQGDPTRFAGTTWGVPWPRGSVKRDSTFRVRNGRGDPLAVQTWPLAHWPDGSVKWSAHALAAEVAPAGALFVSVG